MFLHLLHEAVVLPGIKDASKQEVLSALLDGVPDWKLTAKSRQKLKEVLLLRESFGTTAVGDGVALPHAYCEELQEALVVVGVSPGGVNFSALDGEPVNVFFLLLLPEESEEIRLYKAKVLRSAHRLFADAFLRSRVIRMQDSAVIQDFLIQYIESTAGFAAAKVS